MFLRLDVRDLSYKSDKGPFTPDSVCKTGWILPLGQPQDISGRRSLISTKSWLITNAETTAIGEAGASAAIEVRS